MKHHFERLLVATILVATMCVTAAGQGPFPVAPNPVDCHNAWPGFTNVGIWRVSNQGSQTIYINLFNWYTTGDAGFSIGTATHWVHLNPGIAYTDQVQFNDWRYPCLPPFNVRKNAVMHIAYSLTDGGPIAGYIVFNVTGMYWDHATDVLPGSELIPGSYSLLQNYPNPFNPSTTIEYGIPIAGQVSVKVYNVLGEEVGVLFDGVAEPGWQRVEWNTETVPAGVYFCRFEAGGYKATVKMVRLP